MVNKEKLLAKRKENEAMKQQKSISVTEKHEAFNRDNFISNLETQELGEVKIATAVKKQVVRSSGKPGVLNLIYALRNGKRYQFSKDLYIKLGEPETLQFAFTPDYLLISELLAEGATNYNVKFSKSRAVVYNAELVEDAIITYNLEYSDGCVSKTFYDCDYIVNPVTEKVVAKIKMADSNSNPEKVQKEDLSDEN